MEFAENLWKVALYNLESIDGFYLTILGSRFRVTGVCIQKPNVVYHDLEFPLLGTGSFALIRKRFGLEYLLRAV